jgi:large subunit ribosomal protein L13
MTMKTFEPKPNEIERNWHVIDAAGVPIGRLATAAAALLLGKHKPTFMRHLDAGDFVIVVNAAKAALTGGKGKERIYRHSHWPGGLKSISRADELARRPEEAVRRIVRGMLPHNALGRQRIKKLRVYAGPDHPHQAQKPTPYALGGA